MPQLDVKALGITETSWAGICCLSGAKTSVAAQSLAELCVIASWPVGPCQVHPSSQGSKAKQYLLLASSKKLVLWELDKIPVWWTSTLTAQNPGTATGLQPPCGPASIQTMFSCFPLLITVIMARGANLMLWRSWKSSILEFWQLLCLVVANAAS